MCWTSPFAILGMSDLYVTFILFFPVSKNEDPDQTPHYVAADQGLHFLPMTLLQVSMY